MLPIELPDEIEARLDKLAKRTGRSRNELIHEAILEHLGDLEDLYVAQRVVERIQKGEEKTSALSDVGVRLGLAD